MKIVNKRVLAEGWHITSQTPSDDRLVFSDVSDLTSLGAGDQNAYRYYEGMRVWVIDVRKEYEWRESATGAMGTSFTYPSGVISNGINYGGRSFNFVEVSGGSGGGSQQVDLITLLANTPYVLNILGAAGILDVEVYSSLGEKITNGVNIKISSDTVTLESNIQLNSITVKTHF